MKKKTGTRISGEKSRLPLERADWADIILDCIAEGVFTVDRDWNITYFNRAAEEITGIDASEAIGAKCFEVLKADCCETGCALRETMESGNKIVGRRVRIMRKDGTILPVSISTALLHDRKGRIAGGVETIRELAEIETLRKELARSHSFGDIISKNNRMLELFSILPRVAMSDATVLIEGESGTGKELFARAIHALSSRKSKPFTVINCAAIPVALLEAELFGYKKGSFTGAVEDRTGKFKAADGGTLFLDEIGEMPLELQPKILRAIETKIFEPVGSEKSVKVDVRIIAATNRDLELMVREKKFRQDLFYRFNVVRLKLPPLRERPEDIPLLVDAFIAKYSSLLQRPVIGLDRDAMARLIRHDWPGNVRELMNVIEHAVILSRGEIITVAELPAYLQDGDREKNFNLPAGTLREIEKAAILAALGRNNYRTVATARELGIDKNTLRRKMIRLGLRSPAGKNKC